MPDPDSSSIEVMRAAYENGGETIAGYVAEMRKRQAEAPKAEELPRVSTGSGSFI